MGLLGQQKKAGLLQSPVTTVPSLQSENIFSTTAQSTPQVATSHIPNIFAPALNLFNAAKTGVTNVINNVKDSGKFIKSLVTFPKQTIDNTAVGVYEGVNQGHRDFVDNYKRQNYLSAKVKDKTASLEEQNEFKANLQKVQENANNLVLGFTMGSGSFANNVSRIAKSKLPQEIAPILESMGVEKSMIPKASRLFSTIDRPEEISQLLNRSYNVKPAGLLNKSNLAGSAEQKTAQLEVKRDFLQNSPFNHPDNRLLVDREGRIRELGNLKTPALIRKIEDRMAESGITDPQEFASGVENFFRQKKELAQLEAELKTPKVTKDLEPLAQEARKYKSAEEFASAVKENKVSNAPNAVELEKMRLQEAKQKVESYFDEVSKKKVGTRGINTDPNRVVADEVRNGTAPQEVIQAVRELGTPTQDFETGEIIEKVSQDWPRGGSIANIIDRKPYADQTLTDFYNKVKGETFGMNGGDIGFTSKSEKGRQKGIDSYLSANEKLRNYVSPNGPTLPKTKISEEGVPLSTRKMEASAVKKFPDSPLAKDLKAKQPKQVAQPVSKTPLSPNQNTSSPSDLSEGEAKSLEIVANQALQEANLGGNVNAFPLTKIIEKSPTPVKAKINILDYIRTPDRVLKKIGLGKEADYLRKQYEAYLKELPKNIEKITEWSKEVSSGSNERIFKYLDGQAITLTAEEKKVALEIKTWLAEWADRLDLPNDNRIGEYITHIFDDQLIAKEFDEDLAKIIRDKIPGEVYDPFLQKRLGALGYKQDTWAALDAYVKRATRKVYMDSALTKIQDKAASFEESQWNYVKKYVDNLNMRPSNLDNLFDNGIKQIVGYKLGQRPTLRITSFLRKATYRAMLGLNPGAALRNLSQGANTYAKLGEKYTTIGYSKLFSPSARKELIDEGVMADNFIQDRSLSATKKAIEKMDKGLFSLFGTAEKINRGAAYLGAKAKGISQGMTEEAAKEYAKKIVRDTQFSFGTIDTPVLLQSDIMKTLGQFQTYTTKQTEFLAEMAKNKEFMGLIRYAVAGLAFVYTVGKAFGMEPKELIPTFRLGTPPSLKLPWEVIKAAAGAPDKYGNDRTITTKAKDILKTLTGLIPAGTQAKKSYEGVKAVMQGGSFTKAGNKQFNVGGSPAKDIQAYLFGKYASEEAKNYFNKTVSKDEQAYKEAVAEDKKQNEEARDLVMPTYKKAQELIKSGREEEAQALVDKLSDEEYAVYKKIKTAEKTRATLEGKKEVFPIFQQVQKLKSEGKLDEATKIVNDLNDDQYRYYELIKKQFGDSVSIETDSKGNIFKTIFENTIGAKTASADTGEPQKSHWIRNNEIKDNDLEEAKAVLFGEISNRPSEKQMLEAQVILNTAFNRMDEYRKRGVPKTLTEVLQMKDQYQAYNEKQYKKYKSGQTDKLDQRKIDSINAVIDKVKGGIFQNNAGDYVYYVHKPDGRIVLRSGKLFK